VTGDLSVIRSAATELERDLVISADAPDCRRFNEESQLTAVLFLLFRCTSLLHALIDIIQSKHLDSFHAVLRAFEETWNLAHELRLKDQSGKAAKWLISYGDSYLGSIGVLDAFSKTRGDWPVKLGPDYGSLSALTHPTRSAAMNSLGVALLRQGSDGAEEMFKAAEENDKLRIPYALYRTIWLVLDGDPRFIPLPVRRDKLTLCTKFFDEYVASDGK
jgi:hypothetical protein